MTVEVSEVISLLNRHVVILNKRTCLMFSFLFPQ